MNSYQWADLRIGLKDGFEELFSLETVEAFASISGDTNPLHLDPKYARSQGFPEVVLFGMLTSSLYSRLIGVYLPGQFSLLQGIDIDFHSPCFAGQSLVVEGEIVSLLPGIRRVEIKATIHDADRKLISKASIRVGLLTSASC